MQEIEEQKLVPIEEQISQELVKANVTEAIIADLKERYLPLKINGIEDKETYLIVKEARKECKALRILAKKICEKGREEAVATQKAWISKQNDVTGRIGEVEDYLEKQENDYEAQVAKEKEERKRKQEEQYILRQQALTSMGALYSDGSFSLGSVSFELSLIKESEVDIWEETILPKFKEEHEKIKSEEIEKERIKAEQEAELKRQREENERKQKELEERELAIKKAEESERQRKQIEDEQRVDGRVLQLKNYQWKGDVVHAGYDSAVIVVTREQLINLTNEEWHKVRDDHNKIVDDINEKQRIEDEEKALKIEEERKKEQERKDLQQKRLEELMPYSVKGAPFTELDLVNCSEEEYQFLFNNVKSLYEKAEEDKKKQIEEAAAKKERERIEEEQRKAEANRKYELRKSRMSMLVDHDLKYHGDFEVLGEISEESWMKDFNELKANKEEIIRKQEEERKAEELAQASDKVKWADLIEKLDAIEIHTFKSSQYRKKAAILREKLEEIKAL